MQLICTPLKELDINFFNHVRFYNDGSVTVLTSNALWLKYCLNNERPREGNIMGLESGIYLWSDILENEVVSDAKHYFGICRVIQFIEKKESHRDVFAFGSKIDRDTTTSFYFNNLDLLKKFIFFYKTRAKKLLEIADKNRVITPVIMKTANLPSVIEKLTRINNEKRTKFQTLINNDLMQPLTKQQLLCLSLLAEGKTAKEAGRILKLSYRTIEDHIRNIKNKLHCSSKSDLISIYLTRIVPDRHSLGL